jgi:hypothetical protein
MALYLDIHRHVEGATADDIADAHRADLDAQWRFGVRFRGYWFSNQGGMLFCLLEAPDSETARAVHRSSHGLLADEIFEVVGPRPQGDSTAS